MLGAAVFIPRAARNRRLTFIIDVCWQKGVSGSPDDAAKLRLNGFAQILQNMEAVGDLTRFRRAFICALGERTAAIAADDLDVGVLFEPARCRACRTIPHEVDHLSPLQVHDDGPISGALAPCPIIKAHNSHACFGAALLDPPFDRPEDRIVADRHADALQ